MPTLNTLFATTLRPTRRRAWLLPVIAVAGMLAACGERTQTNAPSQVAVRVNGQDISVHQVEAVLQGQPALASKLGDQAAEKVLHSLVEQELAAQAARSAHLDHSPKVLQALELAKREVLARAYQDQLAAAAVDPSSDEVDRYYESQPDLFAHRRRYTVQDTVVEVPATRLPQLEASVQPMTKVDELEPALLRLGLRYSTRSQTRYAEELPRELLPRIAVLSLGHSVLIPRDGGAEIFTLTDSEPAPLGMMQARPIIKAFLLQERRRQRVEAGMKTLRDQAHIDYINPAASSAAPVAVSSAPSAP